MITVIVLILLSIAAWFLQNVIHEASHLLFAYIYEGRRPIKLIPWPHKHNNKSYFARCVYGPPANDYVVAYLSHIKHIAPFYAGLIWAAIAGILYTLLGIYTLPFIVAGLGDAGFFWWTYIWGSEETDGKRFRRHKR
jgi:hypothetical protein